MDAEISNGKQNFLVIMNYNHILALPYNDYFEYYGPDFKLHISPSNMSNHNSLEYLERVKNMLFQNLSQIDFAPSVQMHGKSLPFIMLSIYHVFF